MTELALRALRKTYTGRGRAPVEAVRSLDVELRSGELLGLLGPSGCGKSTTLRMIAGLETVTGGDILIGGSSVVALPARQRNIGVAFENYALYPPLTVAENLGFGLAARGGAAGPRSAAGSPGWPNASGSPTSWTPARPGSPAARSSASPWPAP